MRLGDDLLESPDEGGDPRVIIGHGPAVPRGAEGHIPLGFGDINTNKALGRQTYSSLARPCRMRALRLRTTVRALEGEDVTTQAPLRSQRT